MKADLSNLQENINAKAHRKENHFYKEYALLFIEDGQIKKLATLRCYGTNSTSYACFWFFGHRGNMNYAAGSGKAGGYGYHRESAAVYEAFTKAGIKLSENISGVGETAIRESLLAIGNAVNPVYSYYIHEAHA